MSLYSKRGVSAQKEEVHQAVRNLDPGLYTHAFCKVYPDFLGGDDSFINIMHADGAGTKSILAYLQWKESGDLSVWKGIAQDAVVMNLDDLLCVGIYNNIIFNSTIDRNKHLIPGEVLEAVINGTQDIFDSLAAYGINIHYLGGETADVGDVVRTIAVNGTMSCRWQKDKLITNEKITAGNVIIGLQSFGQASYESVYNSGIGSNGLTSARHDVIGKHYKENYPETFDPVLEDDVVYIGNHRLAETDQASGKLISELLLSPTRTFAPVLKEMLEKHFEKIHGLVHCSGGGQTKCLKYLPKPLRIIKDNLFQPPPVFELIQKNSGSSNRDMYEVFNMGCRMEIYCNEKDAQVLSAIANDFNIDARIIGRVEEGPRELIIYCDDEQLHYT